MSDSPPATRPPPINLAYLSPAMRQYRPFKDQQPGSVLFCRSDNVDAARWEAAR